MLWAPTYMCSIGWRYTAIHPTRPLLQLTYEGLLGEVFGLSCGQVKTEADGEATKPLARRSSTCGQGGRPIFSGQGGRPICGPPHLLALSKQCPIKPQAAPAQYVS